MKNTNNRKRKYNTPILSIYQITADIYELRISTENFVYIEKLYYGLNELIEFLRIALPSQERYLKRILACLRSRKYYLSILF